MEDGNGLMRGMDAICVICVVSLWTGSSSIVGQNAPTQPAASSGWDAEAALGLSRIRVWMDQSRPNLCHKQSLGMSSQAQKCPGQPFSTSSMHWTSEKYLWRWEHKPELQDSSLHRPLQTLNSKRKIHPRIPQWMFMLELSLCFWNPFISFLNLFRQFKIYKVRISRLKLNKLSRLLELLRCVKVYKLNFPRIAVNVAEIVRLYVTMCNIHRMQVLHCSCRILEG